jgi:hypothetical protein
MPADNKQIYIPNLHVNGTFIEEVGATQDKVVYPGAVFDVKLTMEDFENPEDYHTVWIAITKAVKAKLNNGLHKPT